MGVEGHNPSGHCLIASNIIDYVPLSTTSEEHPSKRQALDHNLLSKASLDTPEVSMVCKFRFSVTLHAPISLAHLNFIKNLALTAYTSTHTSLRISDV